MFSLHVKREDSPITRMDEVLPPILCIIIAHSEEVVVFYMFSLVYFLHIACGVLIEAFGFWFLPLMTFEGRLCNRKDNCEVLLNMKGTYSIQRKEKQSHGKWKTKLSLSFRLETTFPSSSQVMRCFF